MWYDSRFSNNPEYTGYIVKEKVRCGKKNCKCYREGKKHEAFYLYWREYQEDCTWKLRKKYLKKSEISQWQKKIASHKAIFICGKLKGWQAHRIADEYPKIESQKEYMLKAFELFNGSRNAKKWLYYNSEEADEYKQRMARMAKFVAVLGKVSKLIRKIR